MNKKVLILAGLIFAAGVCAFAQGFEFDMGLYYGLTFPYPSGSAEPAYIRADTPADPQPDNPDNSTPGDSGAASSPAPVHGVGAVVQLGYLGKITETMSWDILVDGRIGASFGGGGYVDFTIGGIATFYPFSWLGIGAGGGYDLTNGGYITFAIPILVSDWGKIVLSYNHYLPENKLGRVSLALCFRGAAAVDLYNRITNKDAEYTPSPSQAASAPRSGHNLDGTYRRGNETLIITGNTIAQSGPANIWHGTCSVSGNTLTITYTEPGLAGASAAFVILPDGQLWNQGGVFVLEDY